MIPALASVFPEPFASIAEPLVLDDDPRPHIDGAKLLKVDILRELLGRFAENYPEPEALAVATQWSKWHFSIFLTPVVAANILADWMLPVAVKEIGIILSADSRTLAVRLPHEGHRMQFPDPEMRFSSLLNEHLAPLIGAISEAGGLPAKVLWSNAGNVFETVVTNCATVCGERHPGVVAGRSLLAARTDGHGQQNPLFQPIRYVGTKKSRQRRICCLRYRMGSLSLCKSCPLDCVPAKHAGRKTEARAVT